MIYVCVCFANTQILQYMVSPVYVCLCMFRQYTNSPIYGSFSLCMSVYVPPIHKFSNIWFLQFMYFCVCSANTQILQYMVPPVHVCLCMFLQYTNSPIYRSSSLCMSVYVPPIHKFSNIWFLQFKYPPM